MIKTTITAAGAALVNEYLEDAKAKTGDGFVAALLWKVQDTKRPGSAPEITIGFVRRGEADVSRAMSCENIAVAIYNYIPDDVIEREGTAIDVRDRKLIISRP